MLSRFSLNDIIQSLNSPAHYFKTLKNVVFNVNGGLCNYTTRESYVFIVNNGEAKQYLKFYKDYSLEKVRVDYNTVVNAYEMGDAPFSKAVWLKDEFYFSYDNKGEFCDVVCYEDDSVESIENFIYSTKTSDNVRVSVMKFKSFLSTLQWVVCSDYIIDKLSLDSFYINKELDVKINIFDVNIRKSSSSSEKVDFHKHIACILKGALHLLMLNSDNKMLQDIVSVLEQPGSDILGVIAMLNGFDFIDFNNTSSDINCFNNPKYVIGNNRSENRIIVVDKTSKLKGFINYKGVLVTNCIYDELVNYVEGYSVAVLAGKAGVIDKNNRVIVDFMWDWVEYEHNYNLFIAIKDDVSVVLNRKSELMLDEKFKFVESFIDGYAIVTTLDNKVGVINQNCSYVIEPKYDYIKYCYLNDFELLINGEKELISL